MKISIICALLVSAFSLSGCIPFPSSEVRFFEMKGRVVDADTHTPISGARVAILDAPSISTTTDKDGRFDVERQRNYYVGVILHTDVPLGPEKHWSPSLRVSAKGYSEIAIWAGDDNSSYDQPNQCFILKDIPLKHETAAKEPNQSPQPKQASGPRG